MGSSEALSSFLNNIGRAALGIGLGATIINSSLFTLDGGQSAVLFDRFRGVIVDSIGEGALYTSGSIATNAVQLRYSNLTTNFLFRHQGSANGKSHSANGKRGARSLFWRNLTPINSSSTRSKASQRELNSSSQGLQHCAILCDLAERSKFVVAKQSRSVGASIIRAKGERICHDDSDRNGVDVAEGDCMPKSLKLLMSRFSVI